MQAIILAGGKGSRLRPLTFSLPKPLVPLGERPILEILILQLKAAGCTRITLAVNHMAELIMAFCGDGSKFGLSIEYSKETEPLGTAAPLRLIKNLEDNFLVLNGDVLTNLSFSRFFDQHLKSGNEMTVCTYQKSIPIDLGVLDLDEAGKFRKYIEKPTYHFRVSTGIYALSKEVLKFIPPTGKYDLPDLVTAIDSNKRKLGLFFDPAMTWLDIGRPDDYEQAVQTFEKSPGEFLRT